ncbi:MAG: histidine kinase N-terminal 7TM domain-containing protein [Herpetosiphon sp.]
MLGTSQSFGPISILAGVNILLEQAILIVTFSLLFYVASRNARNTVARAAALLLVGVVVVYGVDVLLLKAQRDTTRIFLVRARWLGIALVPAAYLHLSDALLTTVGYPSLRRWRLIQSGYVAAAFFVILASFGELLLRGNAPSLFSEPNRPGPFFPLFVIFFFIATFGGLYNIERTRRRSHTTASRRRLTYLGISFLAPGLAVFPYLLHIVWGSTFAPTLGLLITDLANVGIAIMILVLTYSVAFQGVLLPDRVVKQDFIRWLLIGPFVGVTVIFCFKVLPLGASAFGLPQDTMVTFGVMIFTVLMPNLIDYLRPRLEGLLLWQDRDQIRWLQRIDRRAFTNSDLRRLLENTLVTICGALRVESGFVAAPEAEGGIVKASAGPRHVIKRFLHDHNLLELLEEAQSQPARPRGSVPQASSFLVAGQYSLLPLHSADGDFLGMVGVSCPMTGLTLEVRRLIGTLAHQMELALENVQLQERIYGALRTITPEMQTLQQMAVQPEAALPQTLGDLDGDVAMLPHFDQLVKDALNHYWGGPKLSESPLLGLKTVRRLLDDGGSATKALQAVLREAIENLRPADQLNPTAQEWLLYNILSLRFLQGLRSREIADKLAMSESDFYRKQRVAVIEVARQLALMEEQERGS